MDRSKQITLQFKEFSATKMSLIEKEEIKTENYFVSFEIESRTKFNYNNSVVYLLDDHSVLNDISFFDNYSSAISSPFFKGILIVVIVPKHLYPIFLKYMENKQKQKLIKFECQEISILQFEASFHEKQTIKDAKKYLVTFLKQTLQLKNVNESLKIQYKPDFLLESSYLLGLQSNEISFSIAFNSPSISSYSILSSPFSSSTILSSPFSSSTILSSSFSPSSGHFSQALMVAPGSSRMYVQKPFLLKHIFTANTFKITNEYFDRSISELIEKIWLNTSYYYYYMENSKTYHILNNETKASMEKILRTINNNNISIFYIKRKSSELIPIILCENDKNHPLGLILFYQKKPNEYSITEMVIVTRFKELFNISSKKDIKLEVYDNKDVLKKIINFRSQNDWKNYLIISPTFSHFLKKQIQ